MIKRCPECQTTFKPRRSDQSYCGSTCNTAAEKRALVRSRRLYRALYHWRASRDNPEDMKFLCREIASWVEEDKKAGRGKPPRHDHSQDRGHQRRMTVSPGPSAS